METSVVLAIAFALGIDAFAVAMAVGLADPRYNLRRLLRLAWHFGLFQSGMALIGWGLGLSVKEIIENLDHWIAFILLLIVGVNMIRECFEDEEKRHFRGDPTKGGSLVLLSVATSIDSLAVGLGFAMLPYGVLVPSLIIGVTAALMTAAGMLLGGKLGTWAGRLKWVQAGGGVVLILIGLRILFEHRAF